LPPHQPRMRATRSRQLSRSAPSPLHIVEILAERTGILGGSEHCYGVR
jgi:hypothetical protein